MALSPNPQVFTSKKSYSHPLDTRSPLGIPMSFQVVSPVNLRRMLLPHSLVLHVNPSSLVENSTQKKEVIQTRGGFVEQHWWQDLTDIQASGSTGSFINVQTGLTSILRQKTIAWDRFQDLVDLFHHNGSVFDPYGNIVLQGNIMLTYDRGVYIGSFRSFSFSETADSPFVFKLDWSFKVEETILEIPNLGSTGFVPNNYFANLNTTR